MCDYVIGKIKKYTYKVLDNFVKNIYDELYKIIGIDPPDDINHKILFDRDFLKAYINSYVDITKNIVNKYPEESATNIGYLKNNSLDFTNVIHHNINGVKCVLSQKNQYIKKIIGLWQNNKFVEGYYYDINNQLIYIKKLYKKFYLESSVCNGIDSDISIDNINISIFNDENYYDTEYKFINGKLVNIIDKSEDCIKYTDDEIYVYCDDNAHVKFKNNVLLISKIKRNTSLWHKLNINQYCIIIYTEWYQNEQLHIHGEFCRWYFRKKYSYNCENINIYHVNGYVEYNGSYICDLRSIQINGFYNKQGTLYTKDGQHLYIGNFHKGLFSGYGKLYQDGALCYKGSFANGNFHGNGIVYQDGCAIKGQFAEGKLLIDVNDYIKLIKK